MWSKAKEPAATRGLHMAPVIEAWIATSCRHPPPPSSASTSYPAPTAALFFVHLPLSAYIMARMLSRPAVSLTTSPHVRKRAMPDASSRCLLPCPIYLPALVAPDLTLPGLACVRISNTVAECPNGSRLAEYTN